VLLTLGPLAQIYDKLEDKKVALNNILSKGGGGPGVEDL